jgi:hypothetical protein
MVHAKEACLLDKSALDVLTCCGTVSNNKIRGLAVVTEMTLKFINKEVNGIIRGQHIISGYQA